MLSKKQQLLRRRWILQDIRIAYLPCGERTQRLHSRSQFHQHRLAPELCKPSSGLTCAQLAVNIFGDVLFIPLRRAGMLLFTLVHIAYVGALLAERYLRAHAPHYYLWRWNAVQC